jgi:magnesium transporter
MARFLKSLKIAKGAAPGSYIFIGNQKMESPRIRLFQYNQDDSIEAEYSSVDKAIENIHSKNTNWLNIDGLHDVSMLKILGEKFGISALAIENILNTGQRSKFFEDIGSFTVIGKSVEYDSENNKISIEQISFIVVKNVLISFQERIGDHFESVRERIRNNIGIVRKSSADYLLFALMDCLVDNYLIGMEHIGEKIESIEEKIPELDDKVSNQLFEYKKEISLFKNTIRPLKEVVKRITRLSTDVIHQENLVYYNELDNLIDLANESLEAYFNMVNDHINQFNTLLGHKDNKVMKVLTIFASIFIPLTFIAGIYGTNFDYLPELHFRYAYFAMLGVMVTLAIVMLTYFKKNNWF